MQPIPPYKVEGGLTEPSCFLAIPRTTDRQVERVVREAVRKAGFKPISRNEARIGFRTSDELLTQVDCVVADLTGQDNSIYYYIGLARAMGKGIFLLEQANAVIPSDLRGYAVIHYDLTSKGLDGLVDSLIDSLGRFQRFSRRAPLLTGGSASLPFPIDWDQLGKSEADNLCRELLVQMGFRKVEWEQRIRGVDLIAELPRRDPDGYEYSELWLVSMGRNAPMDVLLDIAEPDAFIRRILRYEGRFEHLLARNQDEISVAILMIVLDPELSRREIPRLAGRQGKLFSREPARIRFRIWDRDQLTLLVQQFPQLAYKYFSDEGRSKSKYRKTPEELYQENVELAERQAKLIADLTEEKDRRIRAERDAVWKDISFAAAHKIGNPIFAIETNLDPLQKRVSESRPEEAIDVISRIRISVEKAKGIVDQFKSLTRAQEIRPVPTLLNPILEDACRIPREHGVLCEIDCPEDLYLKADPERLSECFDELVVNSMHWFDKSKKEINIRVTQLAPSPFIGDLPSDEEFTLIRFSDNGSGVELGNKGKIFDAFFTTYEHGTGLGLALVRRIIEGHGGAVFETGIPDQGAEFEIYLPSVPQEEKPSKVRKRRSAKKAVKAAR